jgi:hypothetical protein
VPAPFGTKRRTASRPNRNPPKQTTRQARRVVARVVDRKLKFGACLVEQCDDILFTGRVGDSGRCPPAGRLDICHDRVERRLRSTGDQHMQSLGREPLAQLRAKALVRPDADHDCRPHVFTPAERGRLRPTRPS